MEEVAARVVEWCSQVGGLYPELSEWRFAAGSKRAALATPVVTEHELVRTLVAKAGFTSIWAPQGDLSAHISADDYAKQENMFRFSATGSLPGAVDEDDEDVAMAMAEMACRIFSPEYVNCGRAELEPMLDDGSLLSAVNYAPRDAYDSYPDFVRAARVIRTTEEGVFFARPNRH
ncbi:MAG: hypothetical protein E7D91_10155 [Cutibacterium avidum]|uniref:hypothetical protein n=1 Tax=Cutibacterium avidum TaxID=33010 RepID=UPI0021A50AB9|nr:hypothetical protein [Cutibacterium avidum]MDU1361108.1 hypothetical protein [Cutibacterium avidum]MDU2372542.1 hypothetical protein [Cutibacterium avidum]